MDSNGVLAICRSLESSFIYRLPSREVVSRSPPRSQLFIIHLVPHALPYLLLSLHSTFIPPYNKEFSTVATYSSIEIVSRIQIALAKLLFNDPVGQISEDIVHQHVELCSTAFGPRVFELLPTRSHWLCCRNRTGR